MPSLIAPKIERKRSFSARSAVGERLVRGAQLVDDAPVFARRRGLGGLVLQAHNVGDVLHDVKNPGDVAACVQHG